VTPPPPEWKVVGAAFDQNGMTNDQASSKSSKEVVVPDGYLAKSFGYSWNVWHWPNWHFEVIVGIEAISGGDTTLANEDTIVPVSVITAHIAAYIVNVEVFCERTARAFESWQISTFEKIVAAYQQATAMYEDKLKAAEVARGVVIEGRNPGINNQIVPKRAQEAVSHPLHRGRLLAVQRGKRCAAGHGPAGGFGGGQDHPVLRAGVRVGAADLSLLSVLLVPTLAME